MRQRVCAALALALALTAGRGFAARDSPVPVLVELFTSEGCSSCPPADTFLQRMLDSQPLPDVLIVGLGHHVTYWDHQGWRDRFSSAALTDRQERYSAALRAGPIYTPQMIVDGRYQFVGSDTKAGRRAIEQAMAQPHGSLAIAVAPAKPDKVAVSVTASGLLLTRGARADFLVVVTEDGLTSNVRAGENDGRTLAHTAVVRSLATIGEAAGERPSAHAEVTLEREWRRDKLRIVAFVQERTSRRVLGTAVATLR